MKFGFLNGMDMINFIQNQTRVFVCTSSKPNEQTALPTDAA